MIPPMLISIDGIDGCGKSTQVARLADRLGADRGIEISGSRWGVKLRAMENPTLAQQLALFTADRAGQAHVYEGCAGVAGRHRVCDRSYLSTVAYQSFDSGLTPAFLEELSLALVPHYDAMIVLDLPVEVALGRVDARGGNRTWCENDALLAHAREVFATWSERRDNIHMVDAVGTPDEVHEAVWSVVAPLL